ncbi:TTLL3_8 [Acanthosepion pharaonis]|uniref:TTLL3_8 n=1 Tax=Acanthosepion pharaonis TaxID=158019 RepID=A0A812BAY5_ACAPH|nr:TTLL3_8 [Sepia pharaonis]
MRLSLLCIKRKKMTKQPVKTKTNKIFTIQGGYATVRNCLRKRGWVENFFRATEIVKKPAPKTKSDVFSSDDDYDDDDDGIDAEVDVPKVKPWEEEGGLYGIMVGLCVNLRNLQWFDETDPNTFFPRCYRLSHEEEKHEFIDDFNFTACMNILKIVVENYMSWSTLSLQENQIIISAKSNKESERQMEIINEKNTDGKNTPKKAPHVPVLAVMQALKQCELFIDRKENIDVDMDEQELGHLTNSQWEKLREWYYLLVHNNSIIVDLPTTLVNQCEASLKRLQILCPQFYLDGKNSVWIVKPGAKSRGRGITCYDRLEEILKLVDSNVAKRESKYVIQKYIERPLLIYNCKFDIRQWFLVTDWNPLTMWFYRDSYLRFCSQQFTLSKFDESIHLCNNAVQKNYKNGPRAKELPENNMWTHHQFQEYLRNRSLPNIWDELIYPGMKKAIICSMFVSQELVEPRKGSFELYGADFMLTDDYSPWLIEINSSPSMEASTEVTSRLCTKVLEDTIKVVLDRKHDKNCDIGRFEIGYKQSTVNSPPYLSNF